jgi:hypothetical protein
MPVDGLDALEVRVDHLARGHLARRDQLGQLAGAATPQLLGQRSLPSRWNENRTAAERASPHRYDAAIGARRQARAVHAPRPAWPIRSILAGTAGTATMTLAYAGERRLRRSATGPLDYDDSLVPGAIVAAVMHLPHVTDREDRELGLLLCWTYGSAFGLWHGAAAHDPGAVGERRLRRHADDGDAHALPLLGRTPPPWRWPAAMLATSVGTHVGYVVAVAVVDDGLRRRPQPRTFTARAMTRITTA